MRQDDSADWLFIGGITLAIASMIVFAALAFFGIVTAPPH
jgi:hypothetical protein